VEAAHRKDVIHMSRTITVSVTAEDIALAEREDSEMDFLAIAIGRTLPQSVETGGPLLRVTIEQVDDTCDAYLVTIWDPRGKLLSEKAVISGDDAGRHRRFDEDESYTPEPFEITLAFEEDTLGSLLEEDLRAETEEEEGSNDNEDTDRG
jgi:hypothetical protein